jgi:hypothetical protein
MEAHSMSHKNVINWVKWGTIVTLLMLLCGCFTYIGLGVDIARSPEQIKAARLEAQQRSDRIDTHLTFTDGRVAALEEFNATNNLSVAYLLQDIQKELKAVHKAVTN